MRDTPVHVPLSCGGLREVYIIESGDFCQNVYVLASTRFAPNFFIVAQFSSDCNTLF